MKHRQLKKLCKKSFEILSNVSFSERHGACIENVYFESDEDLYIHVFSSSCEYDEYDSENTWQLLSSLYFVEHTDFEGVFAKFTGKKPTPSNVFNWALNA